MRVCALNGWSAGMLCRMSWYHGLYIERDVHGKLKLAMYLVFEWPLARSQHCRFVSGVRRHQWLQFGRDVHGKFEFAVYLVYCESLSGAKHSGLLSRCHPCRYCLKVC